MPVQTPPAPRRFGVGIDTSRYGQYAAFLRDDLQPAAPELPFAERDPPGHQHRSNARHHGDGA